MYRVHQVLQVMLVSKDLMEAKEKLVHLVQWLVIWLIICDVSSKLSLFGEKLRYFWSHFLACSENSKINNCG